MTLGQLANAEQVKSPTMSRIVAGLTRSGLARIEGDAKDARRIVIRVTAKGKRVMQKARQRRIRAVAEILEGLEEKDLATLHAATALIEQAVRR